MVQMEISWSEVLLGNISSFLHLSSLDHINSDPAQKYYKKAEEILKLLNPILDAVVDSEFDYNELIEKAFEEIAQSVNDLRELFESWQPLLSKVYSVLQIESLISKIRGSAMDIFRLLKFSKDDLPGGLSSSALEECLEKIKHMGSEQTSSIIEEALKDQKDGVAPSSEILVKMAEDLGLRSNQDILIEGVVLENLKENAELAEKKADAEFFDQLIAIVTRMHHRLLEIKQSQTCTPIPIPPDFCCPLSLELMTDPVIVASGQTYERIFIEKWIDMGLMVCPKTRQTLAHTTLTPNYIVKAFIASWCELNNVKLPDPGELMSLNQVSPLLVPTDSGASIDPHIVPHSRSNQQKPTELIRSNGSSGKHSVSFHEVQGERASPLHPRSSSEGSLSVAIGNGRAVNFARMSLDHPKDNSNIEEKIALLVRKGSSSAAESEELSQNHNCSVSASGIISNGDLPIEAPEDAKENVDPHFAADVVTPRRDSPRLRDSRSRSQSIWRRPSERLIPRIVPSTSTETRADLSEIETEVKKLVEDMKSPFLDTQREAACKLRLLGRNSMENRIVIANCGAIELLVNLLRSTDPITQEYAVTALLNLSINDNNKSLIANAGAIEPLIHILKTGTTEAKENSAATLFSLSVTMENKIKIGRSGAIEPLVDLLGSGTPRGKKDAATALFNLSIHHENKAKIVQAGAVRHLVELMDPAVGMVDKAVVVLANLATIQEGRITLGQEGGIPVLVEVVELGSARGKENAAAALLQLCTNSPRFCNMVLQEGAVPPLVVLSQSGTPRAREKAQALLSYFRSQRHGNGARG